MDGKHPLNYRKVLALMPGMTLDELASYQDQKYDDRTRSGAKRRTAKKKAAKKPQARPKHKVQKKKGYRLNELTGGLAEAP